MKRKMKGMNIIQTMNVRIAYREANLGLADLPAWFARVSKAETLYVCSQNVYGKPQYASKLLCRKDHNVQADDDGIACDIARQKA